MSCKRLTRAEMGSFCVRFLQYLRTNVLNFSCHVVFLSLSSQQWVQRFYCSLSFTQTGSLTWLSVSNSHRAWCGADMWWLSSFFEKTGLSPGPHLQVFRLHQHPGVFRFYFRWTSKIPPPSCGKNASVNQRWWRSTLSNNHVNDDNPMWHFCDKVQHNRATVLKSRFIA